MANTMNNTIDPAYIAMVVRKVIARLKNQTNATIPNQSHPTFKTQTNSTAASTSEKVITAASIDQLTGSPKELFVDAKAIVTPAAKDAAKERGIQISRSVELPTEQIPQPTNQTSTGIIDTSQPQRAASIADQLSRRSLPTDGLQIVLSETPASDVFRYCSEGQRSAMVTTVADVDRFAKELRPTVWVFDMKRMNFMAAVNAAAAVARIQ